MACVLRAEDKRDGVGLFFLLSPRPRGSIRERRSVFLLCAAGRGFFQPPLFSFLFLSTYPFSLRLLSLPFSSAVVLGSERVMRALVAV